MAATNLYQYYTGMGQALPSVSSLAPVFEKYGLGSASGYTGSAQQNTALLGKLQGGGGYAATPAAASSAPATGGYGNTPSGAPQPIQNDPGINDLTAFTTKNTADRKALVDSINAKMSNAYGDASNATGLTSAAALLKDLQDKYGGAQVEAANAPLNEVNQSRGTFANNGQVQTQTSTDLMPINNKLSLLAASLPGASTAYQTANNATNARVQLQSDSAAREISGFDHSSENELAAIQAKVARGQALTDQEFQRETQLTQAKMGYDAQIQAAGISAGGSVSAANINAAASRANTESTNKAGLDSLAAGMGYKSYEEFQKAIGSGGGGSVLNQIMNTVKGGGSGGVQVQGSGTPNYGW